MRHRLADGDIVSESPQGPSLAAAAEVGLSLGALRAALRTLDAASQRTLYDDEIVTVRRSAAARGGWQDSTSLLLATIDGKRSAR